ncbi:uncharacterized protein BCR38DRAFT_73794 [Pseudomassariella vexata]|uniref:Geranylgeranyl transferase type-2 subunit alpha n=1 Tax=Pseudomassariella vexata TaxID=1141098 RepID=A0A1Y2DGV7_9PEZI|nr:uncharacterized protein BCR38DRAFT_73794 [Pseudomassariella vexata]ORY58500.1 hypothetical protein BCR38DRAFT_73794 [Pseudomassariella vexata]
MASHGIARTIRTRTDEQREQDLDKIAKYRDLETQIRMRVKQGSNSDNDNGSYADPVLFQLTTKLLRLNPEYYTIWNVRRCCLTSGLLCRRSGGSSLSKASPSTSRSDTMRPSSGDCLPSSSDSTRPDRKSLRAGRDGKSGISADDGTGSHDTNTGRTQEAEATGADTQEEDDTEAIGKDTGLLQSELAFTIPLLLEFPKCYWIWNYRSWLLSEAISRLPSTIARQIWEAELALTAKMLAKDRRNFHAWSYRRHVVATLESPALNGSSMAETEFAYTTKMIGADLSNFSAWHHRSRLILRVLDEKDADDQARKAFLEEELALAREGLNVGPEDQSLWYYHQFLMSHLTEYSGRVTIAPALTVEERRAYVMKEIEEIKDLLEDYDDVKWIYQGLLDYTLALGSLGGEGKGNEAEGFKDDMQEWLAKLRKLDPMRNGRWDDVEKTLEGW